MKSSSDRFTHAGVAISVDASGIFRAVCGGSELEAPSLAAIKKKINATSRSTFKAFDAFSIRITWDEDPPEIERFRIVGVAQRGSRNYHDGKTWIDDRGRTHAYGIYPATPKNLERLEKYIGALEANGKIRKKMKAEEELLESLLEVMNVKDAIA